MEGFKRLNGEDLRIKFDFLPNFDFTTEISPYKEIIGQDRAIDAIDMGLSLDRYGYNIFVCGNNGTGKKSYVINKIKEYAKSFKAPNDWCYVHNFIDNDKPIALPLASGVSRSFKADMNDLINNLLEEVPKFFSSEEFEKNRNKIIEKYQKDILNIVHKLYTQCKENNFNVKNTEDGFTFTPIYNDEEMSEKQYNELQEDERKKINEDVGILKLVALDVIQKSKIIKNELQEDLKKLDEEKAVLIIEDKIELLISKYGINIKVMDYLRAVEKDIINNINAFISDDETSENYDEGLFKRYFVNIIASNVEDLGLPVVYENFPEYHNLIGKIEYENKGGIVTTDFTSIQGGSLHRANGGYIIIDAYQLLSSFQSFESLKRCLKNSTLLIESLKSQFEITPLAQLKPEEIPLSVKVILIGSPMVYYILYNYDEDFKELFKVKADFEDEMQNNNETSIKFLGFISNYCAENNILPLSRGGVYEILKYSLRTSESKKHFTAAFSKIADMLLQASSIAKVRSSKYIDENNVKESITLYNKRYSYYMDRAYEMYKDGKYIVDIKGCRVGEVNGLTVIDYGDFSFGKQTRITVTTFVGKDGIINIEREAKMSGNIHSKGIMILAGFMGETFGQEMPLSFNASICFEQLYGEIDGDSASAAELIALISSLGNIPIKQCLAITGSVNQRGEIQPVGGINEKIEGFYDICSILGLSREQGVIIPYSNVDDLILKEEVIKAVQDGKFHIYSVKSIEDCFEIICDDDLKRDTEEKVFEFVKKRIVDKLKKYNNVFLAKVKE